MKNSDLDQNEVKSIIIDCIKTVYDPEISFNIYDLGLIYDILIELDSIKIIMTLTSMNCPEAQSIPDNVKSAILERLPNYNVNVEITFEPTWTVDNMEEHVKLKLGLL